MVISTTDWIWESSRRLRKDVEFDEGSAPSSSVENINLEWIHARAQYSINR